MAFGKGTTRELAVQTLERWLRQKKRLAHAEAEAIGFLRQVGFVEIDGVRYEIGDGETAISARKSGGSEVQKYGST